MLLAMDVGNTETVIGLFGPETPGTPDAMGFARATDERDLLVVAHGQYTTAPNGESLVLDTRLHRDRPRDEIGDADPLRQSP